MRIILLIVGFILIGLLPAPSTTASFQRDGLVWSDEFEGPAGSSPDSTKWGFDIGVGSNGWGNNELEYYTGRQANASLDGNGRLLIRALNETYSGGNGITRNYTSARLVTRGKFERAYGRFEARIKLPFGQGIWPAFWMLGNDISTAGWPKCGEIDVMENIGREPSINHGSLHGPNYSGGNSLTGILTLSDGRLFADDFHVFAIEWDPQEIRFYVDDNLYETQSATNLPPEKKWVFDHPFYMILNVAVGGYWPGTPDQSTIFPQTMEVDYVRVYSNTRSPAGRSRPVRKSPVQ